MFTRNRLAIAVMAVSATLVQAEYSVPEQTSMLDQVTVTAARTEKVIEDIAGSVTVIDSEQIEKELAKNIKDIVRYEPGVDVRSDSRTGASSFNIRGMAENRVKIMIDGVDQAQEFNPGGDYLTSKRNFVDLETLKAVEIVKGPASSLYGSQALGGIIAFQTKDPADLLKKTTGDDNHASVKAEYSSADKGYTETLSLANRTGDLETLLIYTRRDHKETETYGGADIYGKGRGEANPLDIGLNNWLAKAQYQLNDVHRMGLTGEYYDSKTDAKPMSMSPDGVTGNDKKKRTRIGMFHEWQANLTLFDQMRWQLDWQKTETDMKTNMPAYNADFGVIIIPMDKRLMEYDYSETGYQLGAQFDKALTFGGLDHHIIYGLNANRSEAKNKNTENNLDKDTITVTSYIPKIDVNKYGLFIQDDIQVTDNLTITPGIRYDSFEYDPSATTNGTSAKKLDDSKVTGRIGSVFKFTPDLSLFGQLGQGYKAPGFSEVYYTRQGHGYAHLANPDLKPEESNSLEIGLRGDNSLGSLEIATFYNKYKNFIDTVTVDQANNITQNQNITKALIKGIEFRGQLFLDEAMGAPTGTSLRTSIAWADGENKETNQPLNSVAPLKGVIGLAYDDPAEIWGGEAMLTLVQEKKSSDISNDKDYYASPGYGIVDLTAYYKPVEELTLRAGLFNLTDKKYWVWEDVRDRENSDTGLDRYTQPGRNVSVSAKWVF